MSRPGYAIGSANPKSLSFTLKDMGAAAAFAAHTMKARMPASGQVIGITLNVGTRGGGHVTSTLQVQNGTTSLLTAAFDIAALTPGTPVDKEGAALATAAASVPKDAELRFITAESGGSSPTWGDATVQIDYVPFGD